MHSLISNQFVLRTPVSVIHIGLFRNLPIMAGSVLPAVGKSLLAMFIAIIFAFTTSGNAAAEQEDIKTLQAVEVSASGLEATTEQTGSYTTGVMSTATKMDLSPRETPQSVSVVTRTQMDDFALYSVNDVLINVTGINVERVETDRTYFSARGFDISNFQVDGLGLPFATGDQLGDIDTAPYDRVEVLRGANGLMSSTGNPSATINYVRKRPTAAFQASTGVTLGSWSDLRLDADIAGPLNESGNVRGRMVVANQQKESYLDRYSLDKTVFSGIVETDLGNSALLTVGYMKQQNNPDSPMWGALPLYFTDGTPTDYDVSTSTSADWAHWNTGDANSFIELAYDLGGGWQTKATLNRRVLDSDAELFYVYGTPDPDTGLGLFSWPSKYYHTEDQSLVDLYATGPFTLGGRQHELVLGVNNSKSENKLRSSDDVNGLGTALPALETWDDGSFPFARPAFDNGITGQADFIDRRSSFYTAARFNLADTFKLFAGANMTRVKSKGDQYGTPHDYSATKTTPYLGAIYDLNRTYSVYASYAGIFNPQIQIDVSSQVLSPIEGNSLEAGVKGEWFEQRLNSTFAVFQVEQNNTAEFAEFTGGMSRYREVDAISTGFELDIAGQINPGWELNGGYTQLTLEDPDGQDVRTFVPRSTLRLSTSYKVPAVAGLKVGLGMKWQDDIHRVQPALDPNGNAIVTRQDAYALIALMTRYDFNENLSAVLNVNNVTDEKYLTSLYWDQGYYGTPLNYSASVTWKY